MKRENYVIDGMFYGDDGETRYFFTDVMLNSGVFIEWETIYTVDDTFYHQINIVIATQDDAAVYQLWEGEFIEPIQAYRIIKDVHELFESKTLEDFVKAMDLLSGSHMSANMQSDPVRRDNLYCEWHDQLILVKQFQ